MFYGIFYLSGARGNPGSAGPTGETGGIGNPGDQGDTGSRGNSGQKGRNSLIYSKFIVCTRKLNTHCLNIAMFKQDFRTSQVNQVQVAELAAAETTVTQVPGETKAILEREVPVVDLDVLDQMDHLELREIVACPVVLDLLVELDVVDQVVLKENPADLDQVDLQADPVDREPMVSS